MRVKKYRKRITKYFTVIIYLCLNYMIKTSQKKNNFRWIYFDVKTNRKYFHIFFLRVIFSYYLFSNKKWKHYTWNTVIKINCSHKEGHSHENTFFVKLLENLILIKFHYFTFIKSVLYNFFWYKKTQRKQKTGKTNT